MDCYIICHDGATYALPTPITWQFTYGTGTPCDEFSLTTLWGTELDGTLGKGTRFYATEGDVTLFYGVVDEYRYQWDDNGGVMTLCGRGMAALLLDNESLAVDYLVATWADILQNHVTPYGIHVVNHTTLPAVSNFSVDHGSSEWQVLYDFCCYHGGVVPRFDKTGQLVVGNDPNSTTLSLTDGIPLRSLTYQETRYGVISEVLVRDGSTDTIQQVLNEDWISQGGQCRRVITLSGKNSYQALRYSGSYQIEASQEEQVLLTITLGEAFVGEPTQLVTLSLSQPALSGTYQISQIETGLDSDGVYTKLTLIAP